MHRRHTKCTRHRLVAVATFASVVLGATALAGASASAAAPEIEDIEFEGNELFGAGELYPFEVVLQETVRARITVWSDKDGEISKSRIHIQGTTHVSSEHGTAVNRWVENLQLDPATMTEARTGNSFNVHAGPGASSSTTAAGSSSTSMETSSPPLAPARPTRSSPSFVPDSRCDVAAQHVPTIRTLLGGGCLVVMSPRRVHRRATESTIGP